MNSFVSTTITLGLVGIVIGAAVIVLGMIATGRIDLTRLVSEPDGKASLSRFQFLIFTFVVAGVWLLLSIESGTMVDLPEHVLWLLGISGATYGVSKTISSSKVEPPPALAPAPVPAPNPGGEGGVL